MMGSPMIVDVHSCELAPDETEISLWVYLSDGSIASIVFPCSSLVALLRAVPISHAAVVLH
jgi:hypothetical protein